MATLKECPEKNCKMPVQITPTGRYKKHVLGDGTTCPQSGRKAPGEELPPASPEDARPDPYLKTAVTAAKAEAQEAVRAIMDDLDAQRVTPTEEPPVEGAPYTEENSAGPPPEETAAASEYEPCAPDCAGCTDPMPSEYEDPDPADAQGAVIARMEADGKRQSWADDYDEPGDLPKKWQGKEYVPMDSDELQLAAMFKEIFYAYWNLRRGTRSQQKTLGPSQIGTPCDRQLMMRLMGAPHVNPGGDGWAAFKGTWIHRGLQEMLQWANGNTGRFATELRVTSKSPAVPFGTIDLLDRTLFMVDDHKVMGSWSLDQLRMYGIKPQFRAQLHTYGFFARQRGEQVEWVALIGWPGEKPSLEDLFIKREAYDPEIARQAIGRAEAFQRRIEEAATAGISYVELAQNTPIADDCRYCPFHMPGAADLSNGACNGRR
jgi:hypothetical protein